MKTRLAFLLLAAAFSTAPAWAGKPIVLPDACGADIKLMAALFFSESERGFTHLSL